GPGRPRPAATSRPRTLAAQPGRTRRSGTAARPRLGGGSRRGSRGVLHPVPLKRTGPACRYQEWLIPEVCPPFRAAPGPRRPGGCSFARPRQPVLPRVPSVRPSPPLARAHGPPRSAVVHPVSIGTCGWSYADWAGVFYPEGLPAAEFLSYYAEQFQLVEVDSTFYRSPPVKTVAGWRDRTPDGFGFSLKVPQSIPHHKVLGDCRPEPDSFPGAP